MAQGPLPEDNTPVLLPTSLRGGGFPSFLMMPDCAPCSLHVRSCPHPRWGAQHQGRCGCFYNHRGPARFCHSAGRAGWAGGWVRDTVVCRDVLFCFSWKKNPANSSMRLQRKCRCSDVGCGGRRRRWQRQRQHADAMFLYIYLYLYISLYICFFLPSLSSVTVRAAGTWVSHWRIQNEGPFLMVLWFGLDQKMRRLLTEVRIPAASCPSPPGTGLFLCTRQLWSPACQDAAAWPP